MKRVCSPATRSGLLALALVAAGCSETLDAGYNHADGLLPVDQRNPIVLLNDGAYDNWSGEYAVLLANGGGAPLAGIVVNANGDWPDIQANVSGYQQLLDAARASGLQNLPDAPIASAEVPLVKPASGAIEDTTPNRSAGATFIVDTAARLALPHRPLVIATGGALTDVADAYLIDSSVASRVVVVSSLGSVTSAGGGMGNPNGDRDPWADFIVASRFTYVQVSAWYDQLTDVPTDRLADLPVNQLGSWIMAKQPNLWQWSPASDQVSVIAAGLPAFTTVVQSVSAGTLAAGATNGPDLMTDTSGPSVLVTACDGAAATAQFWKVLGTTH